MREVSGCDFCGDTAAGTFDVLPPEYDPEGKGKRMVLCDHCRDALASILDPLLDAKADDVEPRVDVDPDSGGTSAGTAGTEPADASEPRQSSDAEATDEDDAEPATPDEPAGPRMAKTAEGASSRVPRGYRKTLRFLQNRETPIERDAAVEMVADAYDFDPEAVETAIDHAVKHGRLKRLQDEIDVA